MKNHKFCRRLSFFLATLMLFTSLPLMAFAGGDDEVDVDVDYINSDNANVTSISEQYIPISPSNFTPPDGFIGIGTTGTIPRLAWINTMPAPNGVRYSWNIHAVPSHSANSIFDAIPYNSQITIIGQPNATFYRVDWNAQQGYIQRTPHTRYPEWGSVVSSTPIYPVQSISFLNIPANGRMTLGANFILEANFNPWNASWRDVSWSSSNENIISVHPGGTFQNPSATIIAQNTGTATISVWTACGNRTDSVTINVVIPVTSVSIGNHPTGNTLNVGQSQTLNGSVFPQNATNQNITWSSNNPAVATINSNGTITAHARGTTQITLTSQCLYGGFQRSQSFILTVTQPASDITVTPTNFTLDIFDNNFGTQQLTASIIPPNANNQAVTWESFHPHIATVSATGLVTAVAPGEAAIVVRSAENPAIQATSTVTVRRLVHNITLPQPQIQLYLGHQTNNVTTLVPTLTPANACNITDLLWSTSNPLVATVDPDGTVTAVGAGTATIRAYIGSIYAEITVNVTSLVTEINIDRTNVVIYANCENRNSTQINVTSILPTNPCNPALHWEVYDGEDYAAVDENGVITALSYGTARIRVYSADGNAYTLITVSVRHVVDEIYVPFRVVRLYILGPTFRAGRIHATALPLNAVNRQLVWESSNTGIVAVYQNGDIRPVAPGVATITVTNEYGDVSEEIVVTVVQLSSGILLDRGEVFLYIGGSHTIGEPGAPAGENTGATTTLIPIIYPPYIANPDLFWESSDTTVVTVDQNGRITAVGPGTATITVTLDGNVAISTATVIVLVTDITLDIDEYTLFIQGNNHDSVRPNVVLRPDAPCNTTLIWTTSNPAVATVDSNGVIRAVGAGTAIIRATAPGSATHDQRYGPAIYAEMTVTVRILPTNIRIDNVPRELIINGNNRECANLTSVVTPTIVCDPTVTWTSSNPNIATVDQNGFVQSINPGTVRITATIAGNPTTNEILEVYVYITIRSLVTQITPNTRNVRLYLGRGSNPNFALTATVLPTDATNQNLIWSSSNNGVATVNANGLITAHSRGTATITVASADGNYSTTIAVEVVQLVTSVVVSPTAHRLNTGQTVAMTANVLPTNANNLAYRWESSNPAVATVDENGLVRATNLPGTAQIRAISTCGNVVGYGIITVVQPPTDITLPRTRYYLDPGQSYRLVATVHPSNVYNTNVIWSSSDPNIVSVDQNGNIRAIGAPGEVATITGRTTNGLVVVVSVRINVPITSITVMGTSNAVLVGSVERFHASVMPQNPRPTNPSVRWESTNPSVARVDQAGNITTTQNPGTAVIRAISIHNPAIYGERTIRVVLPQPTGVAINPGGNFTLEISETRNLGATVHPANAYPRTVTWSSSNERVATVSASGVVTAVGGGTATITVRTQNGRVSRVTVTVPHPPRPEAPPGEPQPWPPVERPPSAPPPQAWVAPISTPQQQPPPATQWQSPQATLRTQISSPTLTANFGPRVGHIGITTTYTTSHNSRSFLYSGTVCYTTINGNTGVRNVVGMNAGGLIGAEVGWSSDRHAESSLSASMQITPFVQVGASIGRNGIGSSISFGTRNPGVGNSSTSVTLEAQVGWDVIIPVVATATIVCVAIAVGTSLAVIATPVVAVISVVGFFGRLFR